MSLNRRAALAHIALLGLTLSSAAWAGHEIDNTGGRFDATYKGDVRIREKDKEERTVKGAKFELQGRNLLIYIEKEGEPAKARLDQIYTTGFKTEVSAHQVESGTRFFIIVQGQIGD